MVTVGMYNLYWCFCMYFLSRKCSRSIYTVFSWLCKFFVVLHNINLVLFIKGYVTDGEFNSLRTQGTNRPVSVIQLIMDAKNEARAIHSKDIEKFFKSVKKGTVRSI